MQSISTTLGDSEPLTPTFSDPDEVDGIFQPIMPVSIQKKKREMNREDALELKKKGLEELEIANLAFSGVANIWMIVKRAPALNVAHVLALRIVASEHRKNVQRLLEHDPLDTLLAWLARPLAGVDREIVVHTLGLLAQIAAHVESQRVALQINILSQLNFILDYCRSSSRSASHGSPEVLQHCMMVISAVAEDAPGQHALCVMGYVPKLLDLMDMGYGPQVDMEIFFVLEAVSQGASGLKEVLSNDCIPRVLRRMLRPLSSLDQDLYAYNDVVLGLGCRLLANVAGSTEGWKQLLNNRAINNMKDVILQAPDDVTVVSDAILVTQRLAESKKEEYAQQLHAAKMLSTCLDAMEYHDHVLTIQQNVMTILSHTLTTFRKSIVAYGGHILVTHVLMNYPFTKDLRRTAVELLNTLVQDGDGGEVFSALERFVAAAEAWLADPGTRPTEVVRHFTTFHLKLKESVLGVATAPKADSLFSSLTARWGSRRAPAKPWVHPRRPRPEEQLASLPVEEGSSPTPLMGSHFVMSLDSSAPSAAVYQEWQDEYMRTNLNPNGGEPGTRPPSSTFQTTDGMLAGVSMRRIPVNPKPAQPPTQPPPDLRISQPEASQKVSLAAAKSEASTSEPPTTRSSQPDGVSVTGTQRGPVRRAQHRARPPPEEDPVQPVPAQEASPRKPREPPMYRTWTVDMVCGWLNSEGLAKYEPNFRAQQVAGDVLDDLTDETLRDQLQVSVWGDRRRILAALGELRRSSNAAAAMRLAKNFDTTLSITAASPPTKAARVLAGTTFGAPAHAPDLRATTTSPLLNDLPKRRLNPLQPEEADMAVPHLLEARAAYLAQMHRRAERDRERKEKQKTLEGTLNVKALQEKVDEVMEEQRRKAHEEAHRQQQWRALELSKERETIARAAYVKRVQDGKPSEEGVDDQCAATGTPRPELVPDAAAVDIQRVWKGHAVRQWVGERQRQVAVERLRLESLWQCENAEAAARCTVDEWEADEHAALVATMGVSLQALQQMAATLRHVTAALAEQARAAAPTPRPPSPAPAPPPAPPAPAAVPIAQPKSTAGGARPPSTAHVSQAVAAGKAFPAMGLGQGSFPLHLAPNLALLHTAAAQEDAAFPGLAMLLDTYPKEAVDPLGSLLRLCYTVGTRDGAALPCLQLASTLAAQPSSSRKVQAKLNGPTRFTVLGPDVPLNQAAVAQQLARTAGSQLPATSGPRTATQAKASSRVSLFGKKARTPWEEFMEERRTLMAALLDSEQIERLHVEEAQWRVWHWLGELEQAQRQVRLELLFAEIDTRSAMRVEEDRQWAALLARHEAVQDRARRVLQRLLEEEARLEGAAAAREAAEAQLRRDTEAMLRKQGRAGRDLLLRDWYRDAATQIQEAERQSYATLGAEEVAAREALTTALRDGRLRLQREAADRAQAQLDAAAEAERRTRATQEAALARLQAELAAAPPPAAAAAAPPASPARDPPAENALSGFRKLFDTAAPTTPKPLPPVQKRPEWESISDAAGWKNLFQAMPLPELATLACGRLVDGYLKTSRRPPKFLMRASQLLETVVVDVSDAGLADTHVAPLLVLLQHSTALQCLHLDNNALTDQSAFLAADLLLRCRSLYRLTLSWNGISSAGALRLLEVLKESPHISCLDLDGNNISHVHLQRARQIIAGATGASLRSPVLRGLAHSYPAPAGKADGRGGGNGGAHHAPVRMQWEDALPAVPFATTGLDKQPRRGRSSPPLAAPLPSLAVLVRPPVV